MRRLVGCLFVLLLASVCYGAEGEPYAKDSSGYSLFPQTPLTDLMNLRGTTDNNGNLNVSNTSLGAGQGPLTALANLRGRTDSSGNLLINCQAGCIPATTANLQIASLGLGTAASATTGTIRSTAPLIIFPSSNTTSAVQFTKADGSTAVLTLDTTDGTAGVGLGSAIHPSFFLASGSNNSGLFGVAANAPAISAGGSGITEWISTGLFSSSGSVMGWLNGVLGGSADTGLARNQAGVVEVNNGTAGTFRDEIARSIGTGTSLYQAAPGGTIASGTGITTVVSGDYRDTVRKITVTNAAFPSGAKTGDLTIYTLAAKEQLTGIIEDVTTTFSGGGETAATMTCGTSAGGAQVMASFSVFTATVTKGLADADLGTGMVRSAAIQGGLALNWGSTQIITCRLTTTTNNISGLTQGSATFYLRTTAF